MCICYCHILWSKAGVCESEVKEFLRSDGCLRVGAYKSLDPAIMHTEP